MCLAITVCFRCSSAARMPITNIGGHQVTTATPDSLRCRTRRFVRLSVTLIIPHIACAIGFVAARSAYGPVWPSR